MNSFPTPSSSSATSSAPNFTLLTNSKHPNYLFKFSIKVPIVPLHSATSYLTVNPCCSLRDSSLTVLEKRPLLTESLVGNASSKETTSNAVSGNESELDRVLVVRRPLKEFSAEESDDEEREEMEDDFKGSSIDVGLSQFAKKMPMFEPERIKSDSKEKFLTVNLDLALYRAKLLARNYQYEEAEAILQKCIYYWPEDGRPYVALGRILSKQSKTAQAREIYEKGCQATQGENAYIWQCWAVLENKMGNIRKARQFFDAATVADKKHVAAWHGWAVLELKQGNIKKARNLLTKGLKYCGRNEYIYQTLALLEAKANRYKQARYLFKQATNCNPKSCASWLAWAQLEMQQENKRAARELFEKAVQASPKNRFAWHVWALFEAKLGNIDMGRKLLKIGHTVNPRDAVLVQSLALLEYKHSTANLSRVLFRKASELDPRHQPVWIAWGWMEWKEGNLNTARKLYQKALSINSTSESAARCLQAWGVLEQRAGNMSAARRLFRSSLNINSQSYVTWMTWASLEEDQGNSVRAEEIRNLYFQQRTEVVDDASWVMGLFDVIDPAIDSLKRLLKLDQDSYTMPQDALSKIAGANGNAVESESAAGQSSGGLDGNDVNSQTGFDLDAFVRERLSLDPSNLEVQLEPIKRSSLRRIKYPRRLWKSDTTSVKVVA